KGVPLSGFAPEGELTTPTGAAIVTTLARSFGPLPAMTVHRIGLGAGQKDFEHPNVLRLIVGELAPAEAPQIPGEFDEILLLETNVDDTPGESLGRCAELLWQAGALDVSMMPLQMKKGRPGVLIAVQCPPPLAPELELILFRETTTLGIRRERITRRVLPRRPVTITTTVGEVEGMVAALPDGTE